MNENDDVGGSGDEEIKADLTLEPLKVNTLETISQSGEFSVLREDLPSPGMVSVPDFSKMSLFELCGLLTAGQWWKIAGALAAVATLAFAGGAVLEEIREASPRHEARENENVAKHDLRTCLLDLNGARQQGELQKQKCEVDLAKAELEKKTELQSEVEKCRAAASPEPRGKR